MSRETYVFRDGKLVPKRIAAPLSHGPKVYVISDEMSETRNPVDGMLYTSKAKYYRTVRAGGYQIVGNDTASLYGVEKNRPKLPSRVPDIKRAIEQLRSR